MVTHTVLYFCSLHIVISTEIKIVLKLLILFICDNFVCLFEYFFSSRLVYSLPLIFHVTLINYNISKQKNKQRKAIDIMNLKDKAVE